MQYILGSALLLLLLWGEGQTAKLIMPKKREKKQLHNYKCSIIKSEKVLELFSSINSVGSEFHSRMVRGKKLDM